VQVEWCLVAAVLLLSYGTWAIIANDLQAGQYLSLQCKETLPIFSHYCPLDIFDISRNRFLQ